MNYQHKGLALGEWQKLTFFEQMANIGSEAIRALKWRDKGRIDYSKMASDRALELLYLSIDDKRNIHRLAELTRLYECLVDYFYGENIYKSDKRRIENYFMAFNHAAAVARNFKTGLTF